MVPALSETQTATPSPTLLGEIRDHILVEGQLISPSFHFSHGQRLTKRQRRIAIKYLIQRDGEKCAICGDLFHDPFKADIDHRNGIRYDHRAENLRLACSPCNSKEWWKLNNQLRNPTSSTIPRRENTSGGMSEAASVSIPASSDTDLKALHDRVNYSGGSPEMQG